MTVSLSLRNHPSISEATRGRIQKLAEKMGYRRDPVVAKLMAQLQRNRRSKAAVLAFVTDLDQPFESMAGVMDTSSLEGAREQAHKLGYDIEEFQVSGGMTEERLSKVLWTRGVDGVIIGPLKEANSSMNLKWDLFPTVVIGHSLQNPKLHRVSNNQYQSILLGMRRLYQLGYRRIGVLTSKAADHRVNHAWKAGYLLACDLLGIKKPLMKLSEQVTADFFKKWMDRERPEAILAGSFATAGKVLAEAGFRVPEDVALASLHIRPWDQGVSGIDQRWRQLGAVAVDRLIGQIHTHQAGIPEDPVTLSVDGKWVVGATAPGLKAQESR